MCSVENANEGFSVVDGVVILQFLIVAMESVDVLGVLDRMDNDCTG